MAIAALPDTDALIQARVRELLESWQPWPRRLCDLGTVLAMRETVEGANWVGRHVLHPRTLAWNVCESLLPRLKTDSAIGDGDLRREIHHTCNAPIKPGARSQRRLVLLADLVEDGYLRRWRDLLVGTVHVERAARCIAAHMLDAGFHQDYLHSQIKSRVGRTGTAIDLIELFMELEVLGDQEYEGMIVLQDKLPAAPVAAKSSHWMSKEDVVVCPSVRSPLCDEARPQDAGSCGGCR